MENHIKWPPLNVTILLRTCVTCVIGATPMMVVELSTYDRQVSATSFGVNLHLCFTVYCDTYRTVSVRLWMRAGKTLRARQRGCAGSPEPLHV